MAPLITLAVLTASIAGVLAAPSSGGALVERKYKSDESNPFPMAKCQGIDIEDATVDEVAWWFKKGKLTAVQLVECYLDRIEKVNPYIHAVLAVNPDALSIAKSFDQERADGHVRGPLHGIPILVKDNIFMNHSVSTSEGGLALLDQQLGRDAFVVDRARKAGVVIIGHANLAENADHRATPNFSEAYSTRGGQTRNAYNLTQTTAGSSSLAPPPSGSLSAPRPTAPSSIPLVMEALSVSSLPSDSLVGEESFLVSLAYGSYNHDTVGPLARTVKDAAYLLDAIVGVDKHDHATWLQPGNVPKTGFAAASTTKKALKGAVYGLPWAPYWSTVGSIRSPGHFDLFMSRVQELEAAGATIVNITEPFPHLTEIQNRYGWGDAQGTAWALSSNRCYAEWLGQVNFPEGDSRTSNYSTLADVSRWNREHNSTTEGLGNGTYFFNTKTGQDYFDAAVATNGTRNETYWTALYWRQTRARAAIDLGMLHIKEDGEIVELDGLLVPNASGGAAASCASVPAYAAYPAISIPVGQNGWQVPSGMCIYGRRWQEEKLVCHGSAMEDLWRWRVKPQYYEKDTTVVPFAVRWPGYSCTYESLDALDCQPPTSA